MPFKPLTEDQFNSAQKAGFSTDQIINFEKQRKGQETARETDVANPAMQGGANAPALVKARQDVEAAESRTNPVLTTLKGLSDTSDQINKVLPFGDRTQPMTPRNIAGEGLKASSFIPGVGPMVGGASYMAGQAVEDPKKSAGGIAVEAAKGAVGGKLAEVALPVVAKAGAAVAKGVMDLLPKPVSERIYQLYNEAVRPRVGQFKTKGYLETYKKNQLQSTMSIKNNPNLVFEDKVTGQIYNQPRNKEDYLSAIDQTQKSIWKDKVQAMSKGATAKGVMIDTEAITNKALSSIVNNKNMKLVDPALVNECKALIERAKVTGRQTPEEVEELLTILNNKGATYWANRDKNGANAFVELAGALRKEMEDKIESALDQGGYLDARKEYGALKAIKSDVLRATAQQVFRGDTTLGDKLLDTFAGEELVRGLLTMRPESIAMSGTTKAYQLMRQYLRNPDRKIAQMFELAQKYSPKVAQQAARSGVNPNISKGVQEAEIVRPTGITQQKPNLRQGRALPSPKQAGQSSGPVIKGQPQLKLPSPQPKTRVTSNVETPPVIHGQNPVKALPPTGKVYGEGFTMKKVPERGETISEKEAGKNPTEEKPADVILSKEDIQNDAEKRAIQRQYKAEQMKDSNNFLRDIRGSLSSDITKKGHFLEEEFRPISKMRGLFSKKGRSPDDVAQEMARQYPSLFDYKDPDSVHGEDIIRAIDKAKQAKGAGFLTKWSGK